jgi:cytosine/adenosine deaminase-related metal-dependent hydrolase
MAAERILIRGGYVLTMDPGLGDLPAGDVLVEGDRIVAVAPHVDVDASAARLIEASGQVVMPGFVDTHRHTWQTQMRAICADWTLADYFLGIRLTISPAYAPEDVYLGNYVGALEALDAGVTTVVDFSHCNNSPAHADAAVAGLVDTGIRALHCYGFFASSPGGTAFPTHAHRRADFERVMRTYASAGGLLTIGAALSEVGGVRWSDTVAEITTARRAGARIVTHTGCVWGSAMTRGVKELSAHGLLGPEQIHVHCNTLGDDEWRLLAHAGATVSISPETELNMGMGRLALGKCCAFGIKPTLSCDIVSLNSGDLFTQMRLALAYQRFADNDAINQAGAMPTALTCTARDALSWATLNGAEACGLDSEIGSLRPGKLADVIVLGGDGFALRPRHVAAGSIVFQATSRDVSTVLVGGRIVKRDGSLVGVDVRDVLARAERSAESVLSRVREVTPHLPPRPAAGVDLEAVARHNLAPALAGATTPA